MKRINISEGKKKKFLRLSCKRRKKFSYILQKFREKNVTIKTWRSARTLLNRILLENQIKSHTYELRCIVHNRRLTSIRYVNYELGGMGLYVLLPIRTISLVETKLIFMYEHMERVVELMVLNSAVIFSSFAALEFVEFDGSWLVATKGYRPYSHLSGSRSIPPLYFSFPDQLLLAGLLMSFQKKKKKLKRKINYIRQQINEQEWISSKMKIFFQRFNCIYDVYS